MAMSKWECGEPGCTATAVGKGGAVGLRAIGWWFPLAMGPAEDLPGIMFRPSRLRCPVHRPDGVECVDRVGEQCGDCAGAAEARRIQYEIMTLEERKDYDATVRPILENLDQWRREHAQECERIREGEERW